MPAGNNFKGLTLEEAVGKARQIVEAANSQGFPLRILGALAITIQSLGTQQHYKVFLKDRIKGYDNPFTDIDLVGYGRDREKTSRLLEEQGYRPRGRFTSIEFDRMIYRDSAGRLVIDVFQDKLSMCHTVDFRRRLELDELTAPLADLLLTKMQIVKIGEKDAKDTITLLLDHPLNDSDSKAINYAYISRTLANDWGFYYTVITNLKKLREDFKYLYQEVLPKESTEALHSQITKLLDAIEAEPKSFNWKMRARIGPRKKWYQDVDVQE